MPKTGVKKACVMHAKLADHRQIRCHFGSAIGWNMHGLAADQNVERTRIEDDPAFGRINRFPELCLRVMADKVKVDQPRVRLGAIPHHIAFTRRQINREAQPVINMRIAINKRVLCVHGPQLIVAKHNLPLPEPNLVQPHPRAQKNRERTGGDFSI